MKLKTILINEPSILLSLVFQLTIFIDTQHNNVFAEFNKYLYVTLVNNLCKLLILPQHCVCGHENRNVNRVKIDLF